MENSSILARSGLASRFHTYLVELPEGAPLPSLTEIGAQLGTNVQNIYYALNTLSDRRVIAVRRGKRTGMCGTYAIRVKANDRVHRTVGSPPEWVV